MNHFSKIAVAAAGIMLVAADTPGQRSGRFAPTDGGLVGITKAVIDLGGASPPQAADFDVFANFTARDFGTTRSLGLVKIVTPTRGIKIRDVVAENGYRFLDVGAKGALVDASIERVRATGLIRSFARIRGDSHDIVIRDVDATFSAQPAERPHLPGGIQIDGTAHDILIERVAIRGAKMRVEKGKYTNGDGFSTERNNAGIVFRDTAADDNSDGGYDLKSTATRLENVRAARNGRNYRFWGTGEATTITSENPSSAHIWTGQGANWRIGKLIVRSTTRAPVIRLEGQGVLRIDDYDIRVPAGTPMVIDESKGMAKIDWGRRGPPPGL
ncbi:hypothetical protein [Sphingomonas sp. 37zxx]|uniref:hypothetical protein n=1 Tax=Sphingomonas sp. 37zxx TaxID=1550073 RepID=UPI0006910973|nr:hypothetical protein [Sphingomonas sp. 37zxx]